jgi:hypothetical protein
LKPCVAYIEDKKGSRNVFSNYTSRSTTIDYISSLVESTNATSYEDFQRKIDPQIKIQLLKQLGSQSKSLTIQLVKIYNLQKMRIRQTHYLEFITNLDMSQVHLQNMFWLEDIFIANNISIPHFLCNFLYIQSMYYQKINTLVLKGPTNTGKSMLLQLLLQPMQPTTISRDKDRSSFHLDQLPNSTSIIFEEPIIENISVGSWKLPMEGNTLQTDMKHSDKEDITRLPVFITTNNDLWMWTEESEREPLQQRYIQFDLTKKIRSIVSSTYDIDYPPARLTTNDIHLLFAKHAPDILQLLEFKEQTSAQSDFYILPSSDTFENILSLHSTLKEYIDLYISSFSVKNVG